MALETIQGTVTKLIFSEKSGPFRIFEIQPDNNRQRECVLGDWEQARVGARIEAHGFWQKRKGSNSLQFRAGFLQEILPEDPSGLKAWLGSGAVKGIGKATAEKLVKKFGKNLVHVLDHEIERLSEAGFSPKQIEKIRKGWANAQATRVIMQFLRTVGIGPERSNAVWRRFSEVSWVQGNPAILVSRLRDNPYLLMWVDGIGFTLADQAAGKLGLLADSPFRVDAGIQQVLRDHGSDGNVWCPQKDLVSGAKELLGVSEERILAQITTLIDGETLVRSSDGRIALKWPARVEENLAQRIRALIGQAKRIPILFPEGFQPDATQKFALEKIASSRFAVLAGGPGMGKTTLIRSCVLSAQQAGLRVALCAPTGRAAKRMQEATGIEAKTIHRLIEQRRDRQCLRNAENPIAADWVIVDECSMLDQEIAYRLLDAVPKDARVLFVGDPDQLPSVEQGNVLGDIIASGAVPVARLIKIFRQGEGSGIPVLAKAVLEGKKADFRGLSGCRWEDADAHTGAENVTRSVVAAILEFAEEVASPVQVLSPMRNGPLGTKALNEELRARLNPDNGQKSWGRFRVGDSVIQNRNNYDLEVFNGDLGVIRAIETGADGFRIHVEMDGRMVVYDDAKDVNDLDYAWCLTVHKSQGGQFPVVALVATTSHYVMLQRNLLYTGITRAEKHLLFVSSARALGLAIRQSGIVHRETRLADLLQDSAGRPAMARSA